MISQQQKLTDAQVSAIKEAACRPGRRLEPNPFKIKGAAWQSVVEALVVRGYAAKCFLPHHVEYVLTEKGLSASRK